MATQQIAVVGWTRCHEPIGPFVLPSIKQAEQFADQDKRLKKAADYMILAIDGGKCKLPWAVAQQLAKQLPGAFSAPKASHFTQGLGFEEALRAWLGRRL